MYQVLLPAVWTWAPTSGLLFRCGNSPTPGLQGGDYAAGCSSAIWSSFSGGVKRGGSSSMLRASRSA